MTENNENGGTKKCNLADLSKIPATEFEKHFHEWMERDDVARGLQAKLRCDLIKNFNKTNLGKQIQAHTMSSTGGSTYRLTLSPLVLALNTLVAEFLYAQNCHFTLSVFCTEIPFRNTLPDFECMRHYRFSEREIREIWDAVTGVVAGGVKPCLDTQILDEYATNPNNSLLLLILKSLVEMKPQEMLRKSVEIQTDGDAACQEKRSTSVQATQQSPAKTSAKGPDNLRHINKYLLILSQKVTEMTREFELLVQQRNLQKPRHQKSSRSREFQTLNKSLDRINENVKQLTKCKRKGKGKRMTNIVESIDSLTKQFGKCAEGFGQVTKQLTKKEETLEEKRSERPSAKVNCKEKQTETETHEKTYSDWIYEMRTTDNGRRFLERVENSISKAVSKQKQQWQTETETKLKQMKSLIKLHYKQKMLMRLSRQGSDETSKNNVSLLNETIETRLKNFEAKQLELLEKLRESSFELQEAQKQLQNKDEGVREEKLNQKDNQVAANKTEGATFKKQNSAEKQDLHMDKVMAQSTDVETEGATFKKQISADKQDLHTDNVTAQSMDIEKTLETEMTPQYLEPVNNQKQNLRLYRTTENTPRDYKIYGIINEAKLRLKQLETESNCLEKHFQIYLERRKIENICRQESTQQLIAQSKNQTSEILRKIGRSESLINNKDSIIPKSKSCILEEDLDLDEEFLQLKEKLTKTQSDVEITAGKSAGSSPTNELKNAIWEAKNKFFENEQLFRERKEKELMAKHRITHKLSDHSSLYHDSNTSKHKEKEQIIVFNINTKTESKDSKETQANMDADDSSGKCNSSGRLAKKSPRRELFPKEANIDIRFEEIDEPLCGTNWNLRQTLNDLKVYTQNIERKEDKSTESSEDLIKQSMAKMKQLFEEKSIESTKFVPMAKIQDSNDETYSSSLKGGNNNGARETNKPPIKERQLDLKEVQDTNLTTSSTAATTPNTTTLTTTSTTSATSASVVDTIAKRQLNMLESLTNLPGTSMVNIQGDINKIQASSHINHISQTLKPPMFNLTSDDSEEVSTISEPNENQNSGADISEISSDEEVPIADTNDAIPASLVITPKRDSLEIGEILSENQATFFPIPKLNISGSSTSSDSELEISAGKGSRKCTSKTSADSESEYWA